MTLVSAGVSFPAPLDKVLPPLGLAAGVGVGQRVGLYGDSPWETPEPFPWTLRAWDGCTTAEDIGGG